MTPERVAELRALVDAARNERYEITANALAECLDAVEVLQRHTQRYCEEGMLEMERCVLANALETCKRIEREQSAEEGTIAKYGARMCVDALQAQLDAALKEKT